MRNVDYFKDKKVTIIGLARSGLSCARLLHQLGAHTSVSDCNDSAALRAAAADVRARGIPVELGRHSRGAIESAEMIIVSPGVPLNAEPVVWAQEKGVPVISEVEAGWLLCPATVIAVTGSSGKTTVTTLIGAVIEAAGIGKTHICGNIGTPFTGVVAGMNAGDFVSLEISSFQLERIRSLRPSIAVMLNFSRNHLDRHRDMREYLDAKKRIFMNQSPEDFLVVNEEDDILREAVRGARSRVVYFKRSGEFDPNQAAVAAVALILGIAPDVCRSVFRRFRGLPHRMERVATVRGVCFINDSKATLAESAVWALSAIRGFVILIAGGRHKGVDYRRIIDAASGKIKRVVLIGEAKGLIRAALENDLPVEDALTLEDAVAAAFRAASAADTVLFSPMCSSFDMFSDYEERGGEFKRIVADIARRYAGSPAEY